MIKYILTILFTLFSLALLGQTFTYSGYIYNANGSGAGNVPVKLYSRTTTTTVVSNLNTKIYSTHNGNGSTNQYNQYASTVTDMGYFFNTGYSNTRLNWSGTLPATTVLNWSVWTTLYYAGASVPNGGDYFSTDVTATFVPKETGTYYFGINSDDAGDLLINGSLVASYYGGHGMGGYQTGGISMTAGTSYTFEARQQEYNGGEGLAVAWKRPSQSTYTLQTDEIGTATTTTSAWSLYGTYYTDTSGYYSINVPTNSTLSWQLEFDAYTPATTLQTLDFIGIDNVILNKTILNGLHYYLYDLNSTNTITISDLYYIAGKKSGRFSTWGNSFTSRLFTPSQYTSITSTTSNLKSTYPGVTQILISPATSGGTANYYLISPGYSGKVNY